MSSSAVNLQDLAVELNLSIATVSRALRGQPGINEDTRRRILETASAKGYSKHFKKEVARTQKNPKQLHHVLVLSESSSPQSDLRYMSGMSEAAIGANIAIHSHMVALDRCASVLDNRTAPPALRAGLVRGIVLLHRWPDNVAQALSERYPTVSIVHDYPMCNIDLISIDERRSLIEIVEHLRAGGHQRVGFFGFCREVSWSCSRYACYFEALNRAKLAYDPRDTVPIALDQAVAPIPFVTDGWGEAILARSRAGVDAWVCPSAMTAFTLCRFLKTNGLRVPEDVAVTGFHRGLISAGADLPSITTTIAVDEQLGRMALQRLSTRMANPKEARQVILVPAKLFLGQTTRRAL